MAKAEDKLERIPEYLLGRGEPEAREAFASELERDPELAAETARTAAVLARLRALPQAECSRDLAPLVLARIRRGQRARAIRLRLAQYLPAAAAALVMFLLWHALPESGPTLPPTTVTETREARVAAAENLACAWLSERQERDGSWDVEKFGGNSKLKAGLTGLAVLALRGGDGFDEAARRGAVYLLSSQEKSGLIGDSGEAAMYNHGIATLALFNCRGTSAPAGLDQALGRAVNYIVGAQSPSGGWGYRGLADEQTNIGATLWQIEALRAAEAAGLREASPALKKALAYVGGLVQQDGGVKYSAAALARTGAGTVPAMGVYCTARERGAAETNFVAALEQSARRSASEEAADPYRAYFAQKAMAAARADGDLELSLRLVEDLVERQAAVGGEAGSIPDCITAYGNQGGTVYSTAMAAVSMNQYLLRHRELAGRGSASGARTLAQM